MTDLHENTTVEEPTVVIEENMEKEEKKPSVLVMVGSLIAVTVLVFTIAWAFKSVDDPSVPYVDDKPVSFFQNFPERITEIFTGSTVEEFDEDTLATHSRMVYPNPPAAGDEVNSSDEL